MQIEQPECRYTTISYTLHNVCMDPICRGASVGLQHERARFITTKKYLAATTNYYQMNGNKSKGLFLAKYPRLRNAKMQKKRRSTVVV